MIQKIDIKNFQSHEHSVLEFDPGVNIILGTSDSGKSAAVIRTLRWVRANRPTGDSFRSWWGGDARVMVSLDDCTVSRFRTNSKNGYTLQMNDDEEPLVFNAIKTEVPQEIVSALNMTEDNIQLQLDAPFLLSKSPGQVAQHFNKIAHLHKIDNASANIKKWKRQLENKHTFVKDDIVVLEEELTSYEYLDKLDIEVEILEKMDAEIAHLHHHRNSITKIQTSLIKYETVLNELSFIDDLEEAVLKLLNINAALSQAKEDIRVLQLRQVSLIKVDEKLDQLDVYLEIEPFVIKLLDMSATIEELKHEYETVSKLKHAVVSIDHSLEKETKSLEEYQIQYSEEYPDICPFCNSKTPNP